MSLGWVRSPPAETGRPVAVENPDRVVVRVYQPVFTDAAPLEELPFELFVLAPRAGREDLSTSAGGLGRSAS
jgi:hypothetical protein